MTRRDLLGGALASAVLVKVSGQTAEVPRIRDSFDFAWKFIRGDVPGAREPGFADAMWRTLDLPHDWSIEGPFSMDEPSGGSGGHAPTGIGWYRKKFRLPASHGDRRVSVEFDGVYQNGEVWINGQYLGKRPYGYISFAYDLTPHLNAGGDNVIAVRVDNSVQPNSRWYTGSGIYRHTWLTVTNPVHVAHWGTFITIPRVSGDAATVHLRTQVLNETTASAACTLISEVVDGEGRAVATSTATQEIAPADRYEFVQQMNVEKPHLWSVSTPSLYKLRSTVRVGDQVMDEYETPFGIREAIFDADRGFLLNGEHVKLNGVCVHHDGGSVGAAVPERVWERRFEILRKMGCNAIRTSHNPPAPEFLDLCDRMGFLVMDEAFDEWKEGKGQVRGNGYSHIFDEWHERDITDFVRRDRNHPSVVVWSCGNEIPDQVSSDGVEILRDLLAIFHREDPTRPVTAACDQIAAEPKAAPVEFLNLLDVVGYNYADRWRERRELYYSVDKMAHPNWRMIGTESTGMGGVRGDYHGMLPPLEGDSTAAPGREMFWMGGPASPAHGLHSEQLWRFVRTHDYVAGDFMWTGIDYLGEAFGPGRGASSGVIDSCGFPKDGYYFYQSQWTEKPMLYLFPHWNWKGREGQFIPVWCYTNCDSVELFLNGRSIGVKAYDFPRYGMVDHWPQMGPQPMNGIPTTNDLHLAWDVPYEPGTLRAVGRKDGKVATALEISTTGDPAAIALSVDRETIRAGRRDVVHVAAKVVDSQGRVHPDADNEVTFKIQGAGRLIGIDNGNMADMTASFQGRSVRAFHGMCLAIVQSTGKAGEIQVTATSTGLKLAGTIVTTTGTPM
jgi:beta-galactosidase